MKSSDTTVDVDQSTFDKFSQKKMRNKMSGEGGGDRSGATVRKRGNSSSMQ
jgi:hypothetical protein